MKKIFFIIAAFLGCSLVSCKEITPEEFSEVTEPQGARVTFLLEQETKVSLDASTLKMTFQPGDLININGTDCSVQKAADNSLYVESAEAKDGIYRCIFSGPNSYIGTSDSNYKVSNFQLYVPDGISPDAMPMYSVKDKSQAGADNVLHFTPLMGVIKVPVTASGASIRSVKIEDAGFASSSGKTYMSGRAVPYDATGTEVKTISDDLHHLSFKSGGTAVMKEIVLICNDAEGNGVTVNGTTDFYFVVEPRVYDQGLKVTVTDNSHRSMTASTSGTTTVNVGNVVTMQPLTYAPADSLIYSENFDTCVWGGDPVGKNAGYQGYRGLLPAGFNATAGTFANASFKGIERGHWYSNNSEGTNSEGGKTAVICPGSDIMADYTANVFSTAYYGMEDCTARKMSDSYFKYRGLWDWYFSRTMEYHGYIMVGRSSYFNTQDYTKGITATGSPQGGAHTPRMLNIPAGESRDIRLTFKLATDWANAFQPFRICCYGAGMIYSFECGSRTTDIDPSGIMAFIRDFNNVPGNWVTVEMVVKGATNETFFQFYTPDAKNDAGTNLKTSTFYIDDIVVETCTLDQPKPKRVGFLGDSITTFAGQCEGGSYYYPYSDPNGDPNKSLTRVEDTYWYKITYNLMTNATVDKVLAYGGTTVINNGKNPRTDFLYRCVNFDRPDIIFIHGGTNDKNYDSPLGEYDYDLPEDQLDETKYRSAYIKLIKILQRMHPNAQLLIIVGDMLTEPYYTSTEAIADHFGIPYVSFTGVSIPKCTGSHPNVSGMNTIASTTYNAFKEYLDK